MTLPPVIRDAIRLLFLAILEHQYVVLFGVVGARSSRGARLVVSFVADPAGVPLYLFSPGVFTAAPFSWPFGATIGVAFGRIFRRLAGPYIASFPTALPLVVIGFFVYRH